jgi:ubiquinone/menaquinone biosynthesis C-methylase UbiE
MKVIRWILGIVASLVAAYWVIVIGEGTYLGRPMVRLIYRFGASIYDSVHESVTRFDSINLGGPIRVALLARPWAPSLDVATGTGRVPLLLARESWYYGAIHGLDLTPQMLELAQTKAQMAGFHERIHWHQGTGDNLQQWPAETFGFVSCLEAVEYFPRPRRAVREMWRVLQPGGTLMISTWTPRHARWLPGKALTAAHVKRLLTQLGCTTIETRSWQSGYDLVLAVKSSFPNPPAYTEDRSDVRLAI